jgi:exopolysaccharide biosynthesis polyprenyl glycosylphosphotransferase
VQSSDRSSELASAAPPGVGTETLARTRPARLSPTWSWLFEGRGFLYVTLTVDALLLLAALAIADAIDPAPSYLPVFLVSPLALALLAGRRLYDPHAQLGRIDRVAAIVGSTAAAALAIAGVIELTEPVATDADLIVIQCGLATIFLIAWRVAWSTLRIRARVAGESGRRTLIVGAGGVGSRIERHLQEIPKLGLVPVGFVDADPVPPDELGRRGASVLGSTDELDSILDGSDVSHVIVAFQSAPDMTLRGVVRICQEREVTMGVVPRLFDDVTNRMVLEHVGGIPVFELRQVDPKGWEFALKHGFDRMVAAVLLVLVSPLLAASALAVRLSSPGPVLFRQRRVGRDGQVFDVLKLRSMRVAEEPTSAAIRGDLAPGGVEGEDRRTGVGVFLRRWKLDELPQLINVVRGQMSLVGPRPERPELVDEYSLNVRRYSERHRVRSGITGWAQVNGFVPGTSLADRAEWDNWYIQNWSLWLDFKILLLTIPAVLRRSD